MFSAVVVSRRVGVVAVLAFAGLAHAGISTLEDGNSLVRFNTNVANTTRRVGMDRWEIDGVNHLYNQWFWFRVGSSGPEARINSLNELFRATFNTNADPRDDTLTLTYGDGATVTTSTYTIETRFSLQGGQAGSNRSDVAEQIRIDNRGTVPLVFSFFQYADFDLNDDIVDDSVSISPNNTANQADGQLAVTETVVTPMPSNREVGTYSTTIDALDDAITTVLNGNAGPLNDGTRRDYTWAFQWDFVVQPGGSYLISKDKNFVPAPGAMALLGLAGLGALRRRR